MTDKAKQLELIHSKINDLVDDYCEISQQEEKFIPGKSPIPSTRAPWTVQSSTAGCDLIIFSSS